MCQSFMSRKKKRHAHCAAAARTTWDDDHRESTLKKRRQTKEAKAAATSSQKRTTDEPDEVHLENLLTACSLCLQTVQTVCICMQAVQTVYKRADCALMTAFVGVQIASHISISVAL